MDDTEKREHAERERRETIESIKRGLADVEAGRTRLAQEFIEELKSK